MKITRKELISQYLNFFKIKKHAILPNASLIPENDPTVLFTTAGMHPLVPYILGQKHPLGTRLVSIQRCIRTGDIEEVGDAFHHTFFEMLGNWSLGDYWKEEAIKMSFDFLTEVLKLPLDKLAVSCFKGDSDAFKDEESSEIWMKLGMPKERIVFLGKDDNWWGPAGKTGPCGPDTEMFYYVGTGKPKANSNPEKDDKNWCEIWNDVFVQYNKTKEGKFEHTDRMVIDTGMGVERTLTVLNGLKDDYLTEVFSPAIEEIAYLSGKRYGFNQDHTRAMRVIVDHIRASVFILNEGTVPSNVEQGYVLRRLIRRAIRFAKQINVEGKVCKRVAKIFIDYYKGDYPELTQAEKFILDEIEKEEIKFDETLEKGIKEFEKMIRERKEISGKDAFFLYQSFGFPLEIVKDLCQEHRMKVDEQEFEEELGKHQELSRQSSKGKFKSGLQDNSEATTKLHTATHILNQALREVLRSDIQQKGSNITPERLRFDFNFDRKLTKEELREVEDIVNQKIKEGLDVERKEMSVDEAIKLGAQAVFKGKYGEKVSVYMICGKDDKDLRPFSCEICAGPHVENIKTLGHFRIIKEEAVAAGVRRIKAILE
ncbi:MAG: alanine--tRNA ligase [Candidatus Pacearchaeota archaeon]|nr:alanine--tRNA ligase [Candidatus Pacearchaeota archaeon]